MFSTLQLIGQDLDIHSTICAEIAGYVVADGVARIRPVFAQAGLRLTANVAFDGNNVLAYSPTVDGCPEEAVNDAGANVWPAEIVDGWAVLEAGTYAELTGHVVVAGKGASDYVDRTIHGSEIDALKRASELHGMYGLIEVKRFTVRVEAHNGRLAFYDANIMEIE